MMQAVYGRPTRKPHLTTNPRQNQPQSSFTVSQVQQTHQRQNNMRISPRLLATPSTIGSKSSLSESVALLPPLPLYRRILRVHRRKLDPEMRILGDLYVKSEFRAHRSVENPVHIVRLLRAVQCWTQCRLTVVDWLFDRVAAIRAKTRRRDVGGG